MADQKPGSGAATAAAVLGGLAAVGGIFAAALSGKKDKKPQQFGRARPPKKGCGCGR